MGDFKRILIWSMVGVAAFHAAYASAYASPLIILYLFALLQLAQTDRWRKAFYSGLGVGLLIAAVRLAFFWRLFSGGALALWLVYAFWIGLFVALARLCLTRPMPKWGWLLIPFLWTGLEYFRSELYYLRFSWLNVGYAFAGAPWQRAVGLAGVYGIGFLFAGCACVAAYAWQKSRTKAVVVLLLAATGVCSTGIWDGPEQPRSPAASVRVAGVQMEFPSENEVLLRLHDTLRAHPDAELFVLSEYTFPGPVPAKVIEWCQQHQRYLIAGGKDPAPGGNFYDTDFVIGPGGDVVFRQAKAVPIQFLKDGLPAREQKLWNSPWGKIGLCICYDLSYTRVTDRLVQLGAEALIVPTMDVVDWGQAQHELHARVAPVRAAEYGLPIFRVASSGISQLADRLGHVTAVAPCPGDGALLAGTLEMRGPGHRPLDRWLGPFATAVTVLAILGFITGHMWGRHQAFRARTPRTDSRIGPPEPANNRTPLPALSPSEGAREDHSPSPVRKGFYGNGPGAMTTLLYWLVRLLYRFRAYNTSVLNTPGPVLLLPNHVSWWDWVLIGVCLEDDWRFVTSSTTAEISWFHKRVMVNRRTFPVDMTSPFAVKRMAEYLQKGGRLVLFPEGRISCTGSLMKLFDGTGFLIFKTRPKVITAYLRGAERLPLSRMPGRKQWFPGLSVHFSELLRTPSLENISATAARVRLTDWLRDQMVRQRFEIEMECGPATVPEAIVEAARRQPGQIVLQDFTLQELTYRRLLVGADLLGEQWRRLQGIASHRIGVLLPNINAMPLVLLSLWTAGKVPAILNFSVGPSTMLTCARLAGLKQVITSRAFIQRAKLDLQPFIDDGIEIVYLEDVRARISRAQRLLALLRQSLNPRLSALNSQPSTNQPAVILFTSGSEGEPKGVELTQRNLLANIRQMLAVIDIMETDRFFNALPLFHAFGLTVGLLLPLTRGIYVLLYQSPLHYRVVPSAFYNLNCTIFFGTNTFLNGYARKAHPYDFRTLRYLFAGAEKVQEATAALWMRKFGIRVLEGYGATECSPCLSANLPMRPRPGSAGQFLPGIEHRLDPVEGVTEGGRLLVRGPNIMRGYLNAEANARFEALGGWYDTGDVVTVDADGYVFIQGRLKRFAKVSGEMVSLAAVEDALAGAFPQYGLRFAVAVVARPDAARGEKLIAVTNEPKLTLESVRAAIQTRGLNSLAMPRALKVLHDLPRLGNGKVNLRELEKVV